MYFPGFKYVPESLGTPSPSTYLAVQSLAWLPGGSLRVSIERVTFSEHFPIPYLFSTLGTNFIEQDGQTVLQNSKTFITLHLNT